jgi:hypothetical protein
MLPVKMSKEDADSFKAAVRRGFDKGVKENPEELDKILAGIGITRDTFDEWLNETVRPFETADAFCKACCSRGDGQPCTDCAIKEEK